MTNRNLLHATRPHASLIALALALACLLVPTLTGAEPRRPSRADEAPLGGEALAQRKQDMERALGDLHAMNKTLISLRVRGDNGSMDSLEPFVLGYIGKHLDPLIEPAWGSDHPEVAATDVNLRLMKAEVLVQLVNRGRAQNVIDEIRDRYEGRMQMLVDYPLGEQSTITDGIEKLKNRD